MTRLFGRIGRLSKASTHNVLVERNLRTKMPDGIELLADHYYARNGGDKQPIILIRTPYGRGSIWGIMYRMLAERGYQVVLQSVRGTFGSGGEFDFWGPNEGPDGIATLKWLREQKWFTGKVALAGASALGYTQWAIATNSPPEYLRAIAPQVTASQSYDVGYPGGSFAYYSLLSVTYVLRRTVLKPQGSVQTMLNLMRGWDAKIRPAFDHVPISEADEFIFGTKDKYYQSTLAGELSSRSDPYWEARDLSRKVKDVTVPVHFIDGWYDIFLPSLLSDYASVKAAGETIPYLTIGPWTHLNTSGLFAGLTESLSWFDAHVRGDSSKLRRDPVSVYVMGRNRWLGLSDWPPREMRPSRRYLHGNGVLEEKAPSADSSPDAYEYDPGNPTPSVGGTSMGSNSGPRDNGELERRSDVLCYTGSPFDKDNTMIGPVSVDFFVKSSLENTDFFARLCDVSRNNRSTNICDGLIRLKPSDCAEHRGPDGVVHITFDLWPTAYCFLKEHRLRLQVSSGAHPRFIRNLGSGEPLGTATTFRTAHQEIFHDSNHPSSVLVPAYEEATSR